VKEPCKVVRSGAPLEAYATLEQAVEESLGGETLTVRGVCMGDTTITPAASPLTIKGLNPGTHLNGGGLPGAVLTIESGVSVAVSGLTILAGNGGEGGGIENEGELTLTKCIIERNEAEAGGGIFNREGTLTINGSYVVSNSALNGGGILNVGATATVNGSTIAANKATAYGGGIDNVGEGSLTLSSSSVGRNTAQVGGGLDDGEESSSFLYGSTIAGNRAEYGGGVRNETGSALFLGRTSRIVENRASAKEHGGGIYNEKGSLLKLGGALVSRNLPENIFET